MKNYLDHFVRNQHAFLMPEPLLEFMCNFVFELSLKLILGESERERERERTHDIQKHSGPVLHIITNRCCVVGVEKSRNFL
jgi:hypothetical protein